VHDFVMRQRQDEIFVERVEQPEGHVVVMVFAVDRVHRHVAQRVVHPPHVPFEPEAEPADIDRPRHHRPGGRFLGRGRRAGRFPEHQLVHPPQKGDRVEVLAAAEHVGDPFPRIAAVIEIQHRGDRIDPDPVDMILAHPVECARQQEIRDLAATVIVDQRVPVAVQPLPRIGMLVERGAVEPAEPMSVRWEMPRHPIEPQAEPGVGGRNR